MWTAVALLLAAAGPLRSTPAQLLSAHVDGVHDGDTITANLSGGTKPIRIRLHAIDAPELKQPHGHDSQAYLERLVLGKTVQLEPHGEDRYWRMISAVVVEGRSVNQEMVRAGWAWWFKKYAPDDRVMKDLEQEARAARRGLWEDARPTAPWEFRHPTGGSRN